MMQLSFFVFFFQAEDGIRDTSVTGVQTCALPILVIQKRHGHGRDDAAERARGAHQIPVPKPPALRTVTARSEERRVGKGCRSRWWGGCLIKKQGQKDGVAEEIGGDTRIAVGTEKT